MEVKGHAPGTFVAFSELDVGPASTVRLEAAFRDRLGRVESWDGFQGLEVWDDDAKEGRYVMVSWWDTREAFLAWFRSADHKCSHARIPDGDDRPRAAAFRRFGVVAR